jgi:hypothetical protein
VGHCKVGLRLIDVEFNAVNGGSFSFTAVKAASTRTGRPDVVAQALAHEVSHGLDGMAVFTDFQARVQDARKNLVAFLHQAAADNKRVYGIGASTKGNVLLQYFGIGPALLPQIGEVKPDKFGAFTPGNPHSPGVRRRGAGFQPRLPAGISLAFPRLFPVQPQVQGAHAGVSPACAGGSGGWPGAHHHLKTAMKHLSNLGDVQISQR